MLTEHFNEILHSKVFEDISGCTFGCGRTNSMLFKPADRLSPYLSTVWVWLLSISISLWNLALCAVGLVICSLGLSCDSCGFCSCVKQDFERMHLMQFCSCSDLLFGLCCRGCCLGDTCGVSIVSDFPTGPDSRCFPFAGFGKTRLGSEMEVAFFTLWGKLVVLRRRLMINLGRLSTFWDLAEVGNGKIDGAPHAGTGTDSESCSFGRRSSGKKQSNTLRSWKVPHFIL